MGEDGEGMGQRYDRGWRDGRDGRQSDNWRDSINPDYQAGKLAGETPYNPTLLDHEPGVPSRSEGDTSSSGSYGWSCLFLAVFYGGPAVYGSYVSGLEGAAFGVGIALAIGWVFEGLREILGIG